MTFLLTDIKSSTQLWDEYPDEMSKALARHEGVIREVVALHAGHLLKWRGEGDSTLSVFTKATDACAAAVELQRRLGSEVWPGVLTLRTRVALHSGEAQLRDGDYYGGVLNRGARIRALADGGEILLSRTTRDLIADALPSEVSLIDEGERAMRGLKRREHLYLVTAPGLESGGGLRGGDDAPAGCAPEPHRSRR